MDRVTVVDATAAITAIHLAHDYRHLQPAGRRSADEGSSGEKGANFWSALGNGQGDDAVRQHKLSLENNMMNS
jgi:hypothetical protein